MEIWNLKGNWLERKINYNNNNNNNNNNNRKKDNN